MPSAIHSFNNSTHVHFRAQVRTSSEYKTNYPQRGEQFVDYVDINNNGKLDVASREVGTVYQSEPILTKPLDTMRNYQGQEENPVLVGDELGELWYANVDEKYGNGQFLDLESVSTLPNLAKRMVPPVGGRLAALDTQKGEFIVYEQKK